MPIYYIYFIYTGVLALILLAVVPRNEIRRLAIFGLTLGGAVDAVLIITLSHLITVGKYVNYGPLAFNGMPLFPLISWTIYMILFLYFLPQRVPWNYIYIVFASVYSTLFANVLVNLKVFELHQGRVIVPVIIYLVWHSVVAWVYSRYKETV